MSDVDRYREALAYIESFITGPAVNPGLSPEERLARRRTRLSRMRYFLRVMGDPQRRYHIVHVTGTSGKGSVCQLLASSLQAAGYKTGLHVTPYLQSPLEKLITDGCYASPAHLADLVEEYKPAIERMRTESPLGPPTYGEVWVALVCAYYASIQPVDFLVLEVGVGGRFDYTNPIEPLVAVINTVNFDHAVTLGETLTSIAWHKAGVIKKGIPAVTGAQQPEVLAVLREEAERQNALLFQVGQDTRYEIKRLDQDGGLFDFYGLDGIPWRDLHVSMLGAHQVANAATAATTLQVIHRFARVDVSEQAVRTGLEQARFPGRMEIVQREPLVMLDGAHNPEKMQKLAQALKDLFPHKRLILVVGIIAAKDFVGTIASIAPLADRIVVTAPRVRGKAPTAPASIADAIYESGFPRDRVSCEPAPLKAVEYALAMAGPDDLVCVTGSLYLVGNVRERWYPAQEVFFQTADGVPFDRSP